MQSNNIDPELVEKWLKGWSLSRSLPPPVKYGTGFTVDVGWPQQKARYVFPAFTEEITTLANTVHEPWVYLKVCAGPEEMKTTLPSRWVIDPPGFMMTCVNQMAKNIVLPDEYTLDVNDEDAVTIAKVLTSSGEVAAIGRLAPVDDVVIYDRIETHPQHRRKGLGTVVMQTLGNIALAKRKPKGILVATAEGKALYETLGFRLYTAYTSVVIPEAGVSGM